MITITHYQNDTDGYYRFIYKMSDVYFVSQTSDINLLGNAERLPPTVDLYLKCEQLNNNRLGKCYKITYRGNDNIYMIYIAVYNTVNIKDKSVLFGDRIVYTYDKDMLKLRDISINFHCAIDPDIEVANQLEEIDYKKYSDAWNSYLINKIKPRLNKWKDL